MTTTVHKGRTPNSNDLNLAQQVMGKTLRRYRKKMNMSQNELVKAVTMRFEVGLTQPSLANYESGKQFPHVTTFTAICRTLEIESDEMIRMLYLAGDVMRK